jgi:hypothetical protein
MPELQAIPQPQMPAAEWALRVELAAMYRIFDYLGSTELIYNHITARGPGTDRHFLMSDKIAQQCTRDSLQFNPQHGAGRDVVDAPRRLVDTRDTFYKS